MGVGVLVGFLVRLEVEAKKGWDCWTPSSSLGWTRVDRPFVDVRSNVKGVGLSTSSLVFAGYTVDVVQEGVRVSRRLFVSAIGLRGGRD